MALLTLGALVAPFFEAYGGEGFDKILIIF